jgi:molybdopterin synthase sulfur carrier subunit
MSEANEPARRRFITGGGDECEDHLAWYIGSIGKPPDAGGEPLTMPIRIRVPTPLRRFTGGNDEVTAEGDSIIAVIEDLERRHPGMRERLLDDKGELRRFVNIYLNGDDIRFLNQLTSKVKDGDDISIVPAIAGGD